MACRAVAIQQAIAAWGQAAKLALKVNDSSSATSALANLGVAYKAAGLVRKALEQYAAALKLVEAVGDDASSAARQSAILFNIANARQDIGA